MKRQPSRRASSRATVVLPDPLRPTSTTLAGPLRGRPPPGRGWARLLDDSLSGAPSRVPGSTSSCSDTAFSGTIGADIRLVVLLNFGDAVAAKLLPKCVRQHKRHHRLADHSRGRDHTDVGAL